MVQKWAKLPEISQTTSAVWIDWFLSCAITLPEAFKLFLKHHSSYSVWRKMLPPPFKPSGIECLILKLFGLGVFHKGLKLKNRLYTHILIILMYKKNCSRLELQRMDLKNIKCTRIYQIRALKNTFLLNIDWKYQTLSLFFLYFFVFGSASLSQDRRLDTYKDRQPFMHTFTPMGDL